MKKVLYICPNGYLGGAETFVINLCRLHLSSPRFEPIILFFNKGQAYELAKEQGLKTLLLKSRFRLLSPLRLLKASLEIYKIVKRESVDIVHMTMPYSVLVCFTLFFNLKIKKVWFQHGPVGGKLDLLASLLPVDSLLFNSSFTQQMHLKKTPCFTKNLKTIPLGVKIQEPPFKNSIHPKLTALMIGRVCQGKNQKKIVQDFSNVLQKNPQWKQADISLKIIGSATTPKDKSYRDEILSFIARHDLEKNIHMIEHQKNLRPYYQQADILIHVPKYPEAFGLVIAEAMSYQLSVLASQKGGSLDLLPSGDIAYIANDDEHLAKEIENIINDHLNSLMHKKIYEMRSRAFQRIKNLYSQEVMLREIEEHYLQL